MIVSMMSPLAPGEMYIRAEVDVTEHLARRTQWPQLQLIALAELLQVAESGNVELTRGPEVLATHRPEYPGDTAWVRVIAVGRDRDS